MTGKYQSYPEHKHSALPGNLQVPAHWEVARAKHLFDFITSGSRGWAEHYSDDGALFFRIANLTRDTIEPKLISRQCVTPPRGAEGERSRIQKGDLLISITADLGSVCVADDSIDGGYVSQHVALCRPSAKVADSRWLGYVVSSDSTKEQLLGAGYGGAKIQLSLEDIKAFWVPVPRPSERKAIAAFLDYETVRIDALIAKQQRLIELLKDKRQAVISHAVTKGLNPDAPMKDSGVEWLGEVPEHWVVTRAKFLLKFVTSGSRGWAEYYSDEGELFFRIANLTRDTIRPKLESVQNVMPPSGAEVVRSRIRMGDLLVSITADLGSVCVADDSVSGGYVSQHVALARPNDRVASSDWFGYSILSDSSKEQLLGSGYGGTKIQLSLEDVRELWAVLPPFEEQKKITKFLLKRLERFETLMSKAQDQITLLQERRTALISAAVTGKIDLRGWQQPAQEKVA